VRAVSFGGGEPLEWPPIFEVLASLRGLLFRSLTTNGLLLDEERTLALLAAAPDKVHLSIHFPATPRRSIGWRRRRRCWRCGECGAV
jgi:MoaA/NifB/PqqE/SkfB family radical SAM enzyme